jgi:hypothetical protein
MKGVLDCVAPPPLADGEGELVDVRLGLAVEGMTDREGVTCDVGLADGEPDREGVGVAVTMLGDDAVVGAEDMLTDGVVLMLADTVGERDSEGVVDGVGEVDTRLADGELVTDADGLVSGADALTDGVALAITRVGNGKALGDTDRAVRADDALAVTDATLLLLLAVTEGVADWEGVK